MKFTLSKCPSVNHLYGRNKWGGLYLIRTANQWIEESMWIMRSQGRYQTIDTPVSLSITLYSVLGSDVDNILKITMDLLSKHSKLIKNDNLVHELFVKKIKAKRVDQKMEIEVVELKKSSSI